MVLLFLTNNIQHWNILLEWRVWYFKFLPNYINLRVAWTMYFTFLKHLWEYWSEKDVVHIYFVLWHCFIQTQSKRYIHITPSNITCNRWQHWAMWFVQWYLVWEKYWIYCLQLIFQNFKIDTVITPYGVDKIIESKKMIYGA